MALAAVHPVLAQRLVDAGPLRPAEREAQEEVPVLVHLQRLVESAGVERLRAAQHDGDGVCQIAEQQAAADVALVPRPPLAWQRPAVGVDDEPARRDQTDVGPGVEHRRLARQLARAEAIVGVEQRYVVAARGAQAGVARADGPRWSWCSTRTRSA